MNVIKKQAFFSHFQAAGQSCFVNDTEIRFIDKSDPSDPTRREDFWTDIIKTRYPQGLNNIDSYHYLLFLQFYYFLPYPRKMFIFVLLDIFFRIHYLQVTFISHISIG